MQTAKPNPLNPMLQQETSITSLQNGHPLAVYPAQETLQSVQPSPSIIPLASAQPQVSDALDPLAQAVVDADLMAIFGPLLFNPQDPYYLQHKNTPKRLENSNHKWPLVTSIYMLAGVIGGAVCLGLRLIPGSPLVAPVIIMVHAYLLYIILSFCCSDTRGFVMNTKPFSLYQETYESMRKAAPYFRFHIVCYHYETRRTKKGGTTRVRVNTHSASQEYHPSSWQDQSGELGNIHETQEYIFLKYNSRFYFGNSQGQTNYNDAWNTFLRRNTRDTYQDKSSNFQIPGFQEEVGFKARGEQSHTVPLFFLFTFLGMGYPYNMYLERSVARYELNILKNITG